MNKEFCEQHRGYPEKQEECFDCVFAEGWNKGIAFFEKKVIELIKKNTNEGIYRDGETAFDIARDVKTL